MSTPHYNDDDLHCSCPKGLVAVLDKCVQLHLKLCDLMYLHRAKPLIQSLFSNIYMQPFNTRRTYPWLLPSEYQQAKLLISSLFSNIYMQPFNARRTYSWLLPLEYQQIPCHQSPKEQLYCIRKDRLTFWGDYFSALFTKISHQLRHSAKQEVYVMT